MLHVGQNTIANLEIFFCILASSVCNTTGNLPRTLAIGSYYG
jgi:hypothetical protein